MRTHPASFVPRPEKRAGLEERESRLAPRAEQVVYAETKEEAGVEGQHCQRYQEK